MAIIRIAIQIDAEALVAAGRPVPMVEHPWVDVGDGGPYPSTYSYVPFQVDVDEADLTEAELAEVALSLPLMRDGVLGLFGLTRGIIASLDYPLATEANLASVKRVLAWSMDARAKKAARRALQTS